ncbi:hypothetical protein K2173_020787 [Erythroxylum novogranatense]|uniref:NF-kappa-B inhibitor-like protein 2 n=1 Tax=Erythroxylum novogranatense TaxID=1862640 RepID=A0AAV8TLR9_9ROSI|nr:hypothetical protein K2173_020787 [Erythroxylum novogranatense]
MSRLSSITCISTSTKSPFLGLCPFLYPPKVLSFRASAQPVGELSEEDVLQMFLRERKSKGDFISKASDMLWQREVLKFVDEDAGKLADSPKETNQVMGSDSDDGFLKLSRTQEWVLGSNSAPVNKKEVSEGLQDDSHKRKKLNFLQYEALKRELMLLSIGIGIACDGYCLITLSVQAAISYAIGVFFSCLYLQLLYQHVNNISKEMIPQIFMKKKSKKIGIRSEDVRDSLERLIKGSGIALSSPRLVIPSAIYGFWILSHHYFSTYYFDFQLVPAMFGMFVYKAAALVQVYRDNEDLQFVFPDNEGS